MKMKAIVNSISEIGEITLGLLNGNICNFKLNQIIDIDIKQKQRTLNQNAFYHLFINFCLPYYREYDPGLTHDELHDYFKQELLGYKKFIGNNIINLSESTTSLSILEFCEFMEKCFVKALQDVKAPINSFQDDYEDWKRKNERI